MGLPVVILFRWLTASAGGEVVCCRHSWGTRPLRSMQREQLFSLLQLSPQNGALLAEDDVAEAPVLAIKGARKGSRFVLAVVDPDAPDPVRLAWGCGWVASACWSPRPRTCACCSAAVHAW